jgi:hypothetical protein
VLDNELRAAVPDVRATATLCSAHRYHTPMPSYSERHHVIPQAWQVAWQPAQPWPNGGPSPDRKGVVLFDARTVPLCRTGHGNVHFWLVATMRAYARLGDVGEAMHEAKARARTAGMHVVEADFAIAATAMERWRAAGGGLHLLTSRGLWGEI